ncbi:biotin/lipoyl-containing protein, partial [Micromonospora zhanjiangensis]
MSRIKEFPLPDLGEGLTEGEILKWMVSAGDMIELNQPIVEVETAKAAVEIPAKWGGRVHAIFHEEGTVVEVGSPIIAIDTDPGAGPVPSAPAGGAVRGRADRRGAGGHRHGRRVGRAAGRSGAPGGRQPGGDRSAPVRLRRTGPDAGRGGGARGRPVRLVAGRGRRPRAGRGLPRGRAAAGRLAG